MEEKSQGIAEAEGNEEFYISNAWLTKLENTDSIPSIHKLVTLSVIYHVGFSELLNALWRGPWTRRACGNSKWRRERPT